MTALVREVEQRVLRLYRFRDELDRQTDLLRRALDGCRGQAKVNARDLLRRDLSERRQVRRKVVAAIEHDELLLRRFRLLTEGAGVPLRVLIELTRSPLTTEGID